MSESEEDLILETPSPVFGKRKLNVVKTRGAVQDKKCTLSKKLRFGTTFPSFEPDQHAKANVSNIKIQDKKPSGTELEKVKCSSSGEAKTGRPKPRTTSTSKRCRKLLQQLISSSDSEDSDDDFVRAPKSKENKVRNCVQDTNDDAAAAMGFENLSSNETDGSDSLLSLPTMQQMVRKRENTQKELDGKNREEPHQNLGLDEKYDVDQVGHKTDDSCSEELIPKSRKKKKKFRLISSSDDSGEESLMNTKFPFSRPSVPSEQILAKDKSKDDMQLSLDDAFFDVSQEPEEQSSSDIDEDELDDLLNNFRNPDKDIQEEHRNESVHESEQLLKLKTNRSPTYPCDISPKLDSRIAENRSGQTAGHCKKHHKGHKGRSANMSRSNDSRPATSRPSPSHAGHEMVGAAAPPGPQSSRETRTRKSPGMVMPMVKVKKPSAGSGSSRSKPAGDCARVTRRTPKGKATRSTAAKAGNDSMLEALDVVKQMEEDEQLARQLQVEMDLQFASILASTATPTRHQRESGHSTGRGPPIDVELEEVVQKLVRLTEWQWQVHLALFRGQDIPAFPDEFSHQQLDEVVDAEILEYLQGHPEVAVEQHNEAIAHVLATREHATRAVGDTHMRRSDARRGRNVRRQQPAAAATNEAPPVVIGENVRRRPTRVTRQTRRFQGPSETNAFGFLDRLTRRLEPLEQDLQELLQTFEDQFPWSTAQFQRPRGRTGRRPGMTNIFVGDDGNDYEELLTLAEQIGTVVTKAGLSVSQIQRLPQRTFDMADLKPGDAVPECLVCMAEYQAGDRQRILTCFHAFHCACIDKWIKENPTCPVCRTEVVV